MTKQLFRSAKNKQEHLKSILIEHFTPKSYKKNHINDDEKYDTNEQIDTLYNDDGIDTTNLMKKVNDNLHNDSLLLEVENLREKTSDSQCSTNTELNNLNEKIIDTTNKLHDEWNKSRTASQKQHFEYQEQIVKKILQFDNQIKTICKALKQYKNDNDDMINYNNSHKNIITQQSVVLENLEQLLQNINKQVDQVIQKDSNLLLKQSKQIIILSVKWCN